MLVLSLLQALTGGIVHGRVVDQDGQRPLAHASISSPALGRPIFTGDSGAFTLPVDASQPLRLEVRRIGYARRDTMLAPPLGHVTIALRRTAVRIESVLVRERPACVDSAAQSRGADTVLVRALEQLQINARQFDIVSAQYPFISKMDISKATSNAGRVKVTARDVVQVPSKSEWTYQPGHVLSGYGHRVFNIPLLADMGSDAFIAAHCFSIGAVDSSAGRPAYRIDFLAAADLRGADVEGAIYLDAENWQIRRAIVRLTRPDLLDLTLYEAVTDFGEAMEAIPEVQHIFATQLLKSRRPGERAIYEEWKLVETKFVKGKPGS